MTDLLRIADIQIITDIDQLQLDSILNFTLKFNMKKFIEYVARSKNNLSDIDIKDVIYCNELLTNTLSSKMNKPITISLDKDNILKLINRYIDSDFNTIRDKIKNDFVITSISELSKYIDVNELMYDLNTKLYTELKDIIMKFGYHNSIDSLNKMDRQIVLDYYIRSCVRPSLEKKVSIKVNFSKSELEKLIPNFDMKLKQAIDHFKVIIRNASRLSILLKNESFKSRFLKAVNSILRQIYSKDSLIHYFNERNIEMDYDQLMYVEQADILSFYTDVLVNKLINLLHLDDQVIKHPLFMNDLLEIVLTLSDSPAIFTKNMNAFILPFTKKRLQDLLKLNDKIGDEVDINVDDLDVMNREKAFIVLDGELYIGRKAEVHGKLISKFTNRFSFKRDEAQSNLSYNSIAYGHIVGKLAFLDEQQIMGDITLQEVVDILKESHKFKKVYTIPLGKKVSRLAKRV